jgi:nitrite reductase/ring-hydroxylating ferredoxin subunit
MKRVSGLVEVSRREFCVFAAMGLALNACVDGGNGGVQTGGLDGSGNGQSPDAGSGSVVPGDGSVTVNPDGGVAVTCSGTYTDVGAASTFTLNTPKYFSAIKMFVVKDSGGFYALTAKCTHQQVIISVPTGETQFHCPAHGADFTFNGAVIDGPTNKALQHYAMCTLASGNLGVETTMTASATARLVA